MNHVVNEAKDDPSRLLDCSWDRNRSRGLNPCKLYDDDDDDDDDNVEKSGRARMAKDDKCDMALKRYDLHAQ
jgi:hypothetical protein